MDYKLLITYLIGFLIVAIAANQIAKVFQKIKFPLITGLIITGIIGGGSVLNFIKPDAVEKYWYNILGDAWIGISNSNFILLIIYNLYVDKLRNYSIKKKL